MTSNYMFKKRQELTMGLADEVMDALNEFAEIEFDTLSETLKTAGKDAVKELKANSPKKSGDYAKGWRVKNVEKKGREIEVTVYNKTDYQLTHLLENGHIKVLWGKRTHETVKPIPHIHKAEENAIDQIERELKIKL